MADDVNGRQEVADWPDPLTSQQLEEKLRELADVALGDVCHDFGTVFETYSSQARMTGRSPLSLGECLQILRAVRSSMPQTGRWRSDLLVLNRYLFDKRKELNSDAARRVLPDLLAAAADFLGTSESPRQGGIEHV